MKGFETESIRIRKDVLDRVRKYVAKSAMTVSGCVSIILEHEMDRREREEKVFRKLKKTTKIGK